MSATRSTTGGARPVLGVFGGSFDPPHLGHAMVPAYLFARGLVDEILVAPVAAHPFGKTMRPFADRLLLTEVAMATAGGRVAVTDLEARLAASLGGPSRTLRLLEAVARARPDARVRLVVGSDIVAGGQTQRWHRWEVIERVFDPIVVPRAGEGHTPTTCALPRVSSSEIRAWLAAPRDPQTQARLEAALPAGVLAHLDRMAQPPTAPVWVVGRGHVASHAVPWLAAQRVRVRSIDARALIADPSEERLQGAAPAAIWVLVRDDATAAVAAALLRLGLPPHTPVLHAAGAVPAQDPTALAVLAAAGHPVGTLHPICSLRSERLSPSPLWRAAFGLEGAAAARAVAQSWVGQQPWLDLQGLRGPQRRAYHAACALAANHLAVLHDEAGAVLRAQGHAPVAVDTALAGLLRSALGNLLALGIPEGITGPASRGDTGTVAAHVQALAPSTSELYAMLSARLTAIVARARATRPGSDDRAGRG